MRQFEESCQEKRYDRIGDLLGRMDVVERLTIKGHGKLALART